MNTKVAITLGLLCLFVVSSFLTIDVEAKRLKKRASVVTAVDPPVLKEHELERQRELIAKKEKTEEAASVRVTYIPTSKSHFVYSLSFSFQTVLATAAAMSVLRYKTKRLLLSENCFVVK